MALLCHSPELIPGSQHGLNCETHLQSTILEVFTVFISKTIDSPGTYKLLLTAR